MKEADGSLVTVKFDKSLKVAKVKAASARVIPLPRAMARRERPYELTRAGLAGPRPEPMRAGRGRRDGRLAVGTPGGAAHGRHPHRQSVVTYGDLSVNVTRRYGRQADLRSDFLHGDRTG